MDGRMLFCNLQIKMKNILFVYTSILLLFAFCACSGKEVRSSAATTQSAQTTSHIECASKIHDFGTVDYQKGDTLMALFPFKNISKTPIALTNVSLSCNCVTAEWPRTPINPGQSAEIKVKYISENTGYFQKSVIVETNIPDDLTLLRIKGTLK